MITCTCMSHAQKSPLNLKLTCAINLLNLLAHAFCFHEGILFILADLKNLSTEKFAICNVVHSSKISI